MARRKEDIYIRIIGTGLDQKFKCVSHEVVGLPANTYHKFTYADDTVVWWNDFGVARVIEADSPEKLGI